MRTRNWMVTAFLLLSLNAVAQQPAEPQSSQQPAWAQPTQPAPTQPAPTQPPASQPIQLSSQRGTTPTTMDQVVDRFIEREHGLMKMLESRNPLVETYLQNFTLDPALGPIPKDDRYFLGRMDLGEPVDRTDYLKDRSMGKHLLGGFTKLFKVQYQPLGFSWMIFADRNDFDRQHYDFEYIHREFLRNVRCLVFDVPRRRMPAKAVFWAASGWKIRISASSA